MPKQRARTFTRKTRTFTRANTHIQSDFSNRLSIAFHLFWRLGGQVATTMDSNTWWCGFESRQKICYWIAEKAPANKISSKNATEFHLFGASVIKWRKQRTTIHVGVDSNPDKSQLLNSEKGKLNKIETKIKLNFTKLVPWWSIGDNDGQLHMLVRIRILTKKSVIKNRIRPLSTEMWLNFSNFGASAVKWWLQWTTTHAGADSNPDKKSVIENRIRPPSTKMWLNFSNVGASVFMWCLQWTTIHVGVDSNPDKESVIEKRWQ